MLNAYQGFHGAKGPPRRPPAHLDAIEGVIALLLHHSDPVDSTIELLQQLAIKLGPWLAEVMPPWAGLGNPVDLWPAIERAGRKDAYRAALNALAEDPAVDAIVALWTPVAVTPIADAVEAVAAMRKKRPAITRSFVHAFTQCWYTCSDKAIEELGYDPPSLQEIAQDTLDWLRAEGRLPAARTAAAPAASA